MNNGSGAIEINENPGENTIRLHGFYYTKYNEYDISYSVNGSIMTLNLGSVTTNLNDIIPECRSVHKQAIVELDRVLKTHYEMEALLKEILPNQTPDIAEKIKNLLNIRGTER